MRTRARTSSAPADRRLVFAHYFLWFGLPDRSGGWGNWAWPGLGCVHDPGQSANGRADIAAVDYPLLRPYDSSDPDILRRHVRWAKDAGIDFFAVDWYGPPGHAGSTPKYALVNRNFFALLDVCARRRFKAAACYEEKLLYNPSVGSSKSRIAAGVDHLTYLFRTFGDHAGYLRIGRRPVLIVWGDHTLTNGEWARILAPIRERFNPVIVYSYFFKADRHQKRWYEEQVRGSDTPTAADGLYPWLLIGSQRTMFSRLETQYERLNDLKRRGLIHLVAGAVWPGFNDSGVWAWGGDRPRIIRDDRRLYERTWDFALKHRADWISIATWNDWNEGSQIEPDIQRGTRLLEITARYARRFK